MSASFEALLRQGLLAGTDDAALDMLPYAKLLGLRFSARDGVICLSMPYTPELIGGPGRLHGGTIGGLLEFAGALVVAAELVRQNQPVAVIAKPINVTVDFLREGKLETTFASGTVTRLGRRIANVSTQAWQNDRSRLIAAAHMNVMVAD